MPLDLYMRYYFLKHKKNIDSIDREAIVDFVYYLMKYKGYLSAISAKPISWVTRLKAF